MSQGRPEPMRRKRESESSGQDEPLPPPPTPSEASKPPKKRYRGPSVSPHPVQHDQGNYTAVITTSQIINRVVDKLCADMPDSPRDRKSPCRKKSKEDGDPDKRISHHVDFRLQEKINGLTSRKSDEFWEKKKRVRKKDSSGKKQSGASGAGSGSDEEGRGGGQEEANAGPEPLLVGSQKRKARKARIERIDPGHPNWRANSLVEPEVLGLATLAEVASAESHLVTPPHLPTW